MLSIHWHGIKQTGTPWSDGSSGVSSCNLGNGNNHTYVFDTMESGTFWYHPHSYMPGIYYTSIFMYLNLCIYIYKNGYTFLYVQ
jgi:FtsP/CotA-like multicopper oxidase with cupredoxin domain